MEITRKHFIGSLVAIGEVIIGVRALSAETWGETLMLVGFGCVLAMASLLLNADWKPEQWNDTQYFIPNVLGG